VSRRTVEASLSVLENLAATLDNLNRTTGRVNALLDDIEDPLRRVMPQLGAAMGAMATLGEAATQLADLSKKLGPLTNIAEQAGGLFGLRPSKPAPPSGDQRMA
jgi:ABC-type transporter Mla subunit MlaD